jgi:hypothetical protein
MTDFFQTWHRNSWRERKTDEKFRRDGWCSPTDDNRKIDLSDKCPVSIWCQMSRRTKGHYHSLLNQHRESFHNANSKSRFVQVFFFRPGISSQVWKKSVILFLTLLFFCGAMVVLCPSVSNCLIRQPFESRLFAALHESPIPNEAKLVGKKEHWADLVQSAIHPIVRPAQ